MCCVTHEPRGTFCVGPGLWMDVASEAFPVACQEAPLLRDSTTKAEFSEVRQSRGARSVGRANIYFLSAGRNLNMVKTEPPFNLHKQICSQADTSGAKFLGETRLYCEMRSH